MKNDVRWKSPTGKQRCSKVELSKKATWGEIYNKNHPATANPRSSASWRKPNPVSRWPSCATSTAWVVPLSTTGAPYAAVWACRWWSGWRNWRWKTGDWRIWAPKRSSRPRSSRRRWKKVVKPSRRKEIAQHAVKERADTIQLACEAFSISVACYHYRANHFQWQCPDCGLVARAVL